MDSLEHTGKSVESSCYLKRGPPSSKEFHGSHCFFYLATSQARSTNIRRESTESRFWSICRDQTLFDFFFDLCESQWNSVVFYFIFFIIFYFIFFFGGGGGCCHFLLSNCYFHRISWNTPVFAWGYRSSMEFHGIFHGSPWSLGVIWYDDCILKF